MLSREEMLIAIRQYCHEYCHGWVDCQSGCRLGNIADCDNKTFEQLTDAELELCMDMIGSSPVTIKIQNTGTSIQDSGERTQFASGAVRDMHEGKGDMASVPWEAILRLSRHYENGAKKYTRWNYKKGINLSSYIDSACRHLAKYQCGCDDEDHLAAAAFNVLGAMYVEEKQKHLIDLPEREGKNTFDYFTDKKQEDTNG